MSTVTSAATRRLYHSPGRLVREPCERTISPGMTGVMVAVEELTNHVSGGSSKPNQAAVCFSRVRREASSERVGYGGER